MSSYINNLPLSVKNANCDLFADDTSVQYASFDINDIEYNLSASINAILTDAALMICLFTLTELNQC